jgi:hypothetical protein
LSPAVAYPAAVSNESIVAADLNNDERVDIVRPVFNRAIDALEPNGQARFVGPVLSPAEYGAWAVALGDFNHDGILAVVNGIPGCRTSAGPVRARWTAEPRLLLSVPSARIRKVARR